MYAPREPNVRRKPEDPPGRTSHPLPRNGARISYRDSGSLILQQTAASNKDTLKSRIMHSAAEPTRLTADVERPDRSGESVVTQDIVTLRIGQYPRAFASH